MYPARYRGRGSGPYLPEEEGIYESADQPPPPDTPDSGR